MSKNTHCLAFMYHAFSSFKNLPSYLVVQNNSLETSFSNKEV